MNNERKSGMAHKRPLLEKIERTQIVFRGLTGAARHLGCSRTHLSYVLHGQRKPSARLARGLRRLGITCTVDGKEFGEAR